MVLTLTAFPACLYKAPSETFCALAFVAKRRRETLKKKSFFGVNFPDSFANLLLNVF